MFVHLNWKSEIKKKYLTCTSAVYSRRVKKRVKNEKDVQKAVNNPRAGKSGGGGSG